MQSEQTPHRRYFHVDGVRCARCIQAIESALQSEPQVTDARVNMSTNRLEIVWHGDEALVSHYVQKVELLGYPLRPYEAPRKASDESLTLLRSMVVAGFGMGNIMLISVALWSSSQEVMGIATRDLLHWISAGIALPVIAYAGRPFFSSALGVLRKGHTNMDVPISLALLLACGMSLSETIHHGEHAYFDSAVMLLFFLLVGRWLDARARGKARENAEGLLAMLRGYATLLEGDKKTEIVISELKEGMLLSIASGEKIPTDCEIVEGRSEIDTSLVTGETLPKPVSIGEVVYGGTINLSAPLICRVLKASEDSLLADIIRLMEKAEQGRARYVQLADKAAKLYTPVVHTLAAFAFLGWYFIGDASWQQSLLIAITTLIITCPCALGLAVPVVQVLASSWLMKRGILLKSGDALERLAGVTSAVFDKTGTLTLGNPKLKTKVEEEYMRIAASLAAHSKHPYSIALRNAYDGDLLKLEGIEEVPGKGMQAYYQKKNIRLGKHDWCGEKDTVGREGNVWLAIEGQEPIAFTFIDTLRDDAVKVVQQFQQLSINCHLLSGDRSQTVEKIAQATGISHAHAELKPSEKTHYIQHLQAEGERVLMVGDGLNDAPALAQANVSISPATGVDITQNAADVVFQGEKLMAVIQVWHMAVFSTRLVKQNFILAILYNCMAIPLAVAGFVTPLLAAIAMSLSSLIVIANSFRINLQKGNE